MKYIEEIQKPYSGGSLYTESFFVNNDKTKIKLRVQITTECTVSNHNTVFDVYVYYKGYKCRNWSHPIKLERLGSIKGFDNQETLQARYTAQNNHWEMLNPLRCYQNGSYNGVSIGFNVAPLNMVGIKKMREV